MSAAIAEHQSSTSLKHPGNKLEVQRSNSEYKHTNTCSLIKKNKSRSPFSYIKRPVEKPPIYSSFPYISYIKIDTGVIFLYAKKRAGTTAVTKELLQMALYALLGIEEKAADKEVKKASRQKALSCHPDKNPNNPKAAELFHQLSQALEVLTDAAARAAYDKIRRAKKQAAERTQKLDEKRKKVKLDLEARERQLQEQQRLMWEQMCQEREQRLRGKAEHCEAKGTPKLKLKWKCKEDGSQDGYSEDVLLRLLQKYGEVLNLVLSSKRAGTAVVEFATVKAVELAVQNEVGLIDNPLKISWLEGQPQGMAGPGHPGLSKGSVRLERDYESLVMMRMCQAAERQLLIAQMQQEDKEAPPS
ncbi:dnaJ homolog subfamily C member 17-like [Lepus europaeus]|uniref:dnaJ homolog subfamily C member 17-like n=1 Tax=Lepus europaeus TaxID=9983 RepID=UPI002B49721B|nr:dnaJ homolog subfamily C member 17-like [Lepus europaeus]